MKKAEDFSEWYNEIVEKANLTDKRYPIKGMNVWTPYGWKIMQAIDAHIRHEFDSTNHNEVCFPLLIPEDQFAKEKEHIKGFDAEVFWVTHAGLNPLDVKLLLRPTSETAMYPMFAVWVRERHGPGDPLGQARGRGALWRGCQRPCGRLEGHRARL